MIGELMVTAAVVVAGAALAGLVVWWVTKPRGKR